MTFADLMGLMMSFFVMLVAFSTMDNNKLKIVAGSMRDAFGVQADKRYSALSNPTAFRQSRSSTCRARQSGSVLQYADAGSG